MKNANELKALTKSRELLLQECITNTADLFYKVMENKAEAGFNEHTDDLLSYFTMAVKKDEYSHVVGRITELFSESGYEVTLPFKDRKGVDYSDTVIRVSWSKA